MMSKTRLLISVAAEVHKGASLHELDLNLLLRSLIRSTFNGSFICIARLFSRDVSN